MQTVTTVKLSLIDPHPDQPRHDLGDIAGLAASIKARGIVTPVALVATGKRYTLVAGQRRITAAKKAGLTEVPAYVCGDWVDAAGLEAAMAENMQRKPLTAIEEARGMQQLLDHGVDIKRIAAVTGRTKSDLKHAEVLAALPEATSEKLSADFTETPATIEEAIALAEFADDESAYKSLTETVGTGLFAHRLETARQARQLAQDIAEARKGIKAAGVTEIPNNKTWAANAAPLYNLRDGNGHEITPEEHAACPGHAAYINENSGRILYYCTKANLHRSSGRAPLTDAQKADERLKRETRKQWRAATVVRRAFVHDLCTARSYTIQPMLEFVAQVAWERGLAMVSKDVGPAAGTRTKEMFDSPNAVNHVQQLFAQACGEIEYQIEGILSGHELPVKRFRQRFSAAHYALVRRYYAVLKALGYTPAECEAEVLAGGGGTVIEAAARYCAASTPVLEVAGADEVEDIEEVD